MPLLKNPIRQLTWQEAKKFANQKYNVRCSDIGSVVASCFLIGSEMSKLMNNEFFNVRDLPGFKGIAARKHKKKRISYN